MNEEAEAASWLADDASTHQQIRAEQIRRLYGNTVVTTVAATALAIGLAWMVSPYAPAQNVALWLLPKLLIVLPRFVLAWRYQRAADADDPVWYRRFAMWLAADGLVWGLAGAFLMPADRLDVTAVVGAALMGLCAASAFVLHAVWQAALLYVVPIMLPTAFTLMSRLDAIGVFAGLGVCGYTVVMLMESRRSEQRLIELLGLRFSTDRIARERAEALRLAQQHSAVKSQFLATMSHEMRTPLHGILGLTRLVLESETDSEARRRLELVERSGEHLLTVINDILDFSKIEAGHLSIERRPFDLAAAVDDVVTLITVQAQAKGLVLAATVEVGQPCLVEGDVARFRQVLWNLLGNAVKFTEQGRVMLRVTREAGGLIAVTVSDTGIGIPPDHLGRIFEPFQQVDGAFNRRYGGTGLGLAISRQLARGMGGDVVCASEPGRGSVFVFTARLPEAGAARPAGSTKEARRMLSPARALLAEDNAVNALVAQTMLERCGLKVETVADGAAAVDRMRTHPRPEIVFMDCQMPRLDGFAATRRIRAEEASAGLPRVPIVALTANAMDVDRQRCLDAGMDDHLAKPFTEEQLMAVIRQRVPPGGGSSWPGLNG